MHYLFFWCHEEPVLRTSPFIEKGRKLCIICFSGAMKNAKRKTCKKQLISLHISREHQYGLSMNIVIVKFTKQ